jgi:PAS domain S-box-containing protein
MRGTTAIDEVGNSQLFTNSRQRRQVSVLVAFIFLGAAVFGAWQSYLGFMHRRQALEHNTLERALASARIIDRETSAAAHLLRSLAASPALAKGDLSTFYEQMRAAAPKQTWLVLNDAHGPVLNTRLPFGSALNAPASYDWLHGDAINEVRKGHLWISNREFGPISRQYCVAVRLRIDGADGEMKYYLSLVMADPQLRELEQQYRTANDVPDGIFDRKFELIVADEQGLQFDPSDVALIRARVQQGERSGSVFVGGLFESPHVLAFAVATESGWTAVAQTNLTLLGDLSGSSRFRLIGFGVVSLLLMGLGSALIANRWLGLPFEILKRASDQTRQRYSTYWEQSSEGLYIVNVSPGGGFSYEAINPRLEHWIDVTNEQIRGKSPHDCLPRAVADLAVKNYQRCIATRRPLQFENSVEKDGHVSTWETILTPVFGASGQVVQLLGRSKEITERLEMQRQLLDSEQRLAAVAKAVPGFLFVAAPDGRIEYFNDQLAKYVGISVDRSEPINLTLLVHPDDRRSVLTTSARAAAKPEPFSIECRILAAGGASRWFLVRAAPVQQGDAIRWFGIATDIHHRKQLSAAVAESRQRLQNILEGISDCYFAIDRQGLIIALNTRAARWFGRPADMLIGANYRTLGPMSSRDAKAFHAAVEDVIARGVRIHEELPSKVYEGRWIDIQVSPADEGAVILFRDITDRKLSEQRAAQSLGLIQSSLDALSARIAILDGGGFVIAVNRAWQAFNAGKTQMNPGADYKESCECPELRDGLIRAVNGHGSFKLTYSLENDASQRWYQVTVAPFKQNNATADCNRTARFNGSISRRGRVEHGRSAQRNGRDRRSNCAV